MSFQRIVEYYMLQDLDGDSIERLIGKQPILYEDLKKYKSLSDLCPRNSNFQVILYEELEYSGHYVALIVDYDNRIVNFFDSYGLYPDKENQYLAYNNKLPRYLTNLLQSSGFTIVFNKIDYQSKKNTKVSTCGRWSCCRILLKHLTNEQFEKIFIGNKNGWLTPDIIVTCISLLGLNDFNNFFLK